MKEALNSFEMRKKAEANVQKEYQSYDIIAPRIVTMLYSTPRTLAQAASIEHPEVFKEEEKKEHLCSYDVTKCWPPNRGYASPCPLF